MKIYFIKGEEDKSEISADPYGLQFEISHVAKYEIVIGESCENFEEIFNTYLGDTPISPRLNVLHIRIQKPSWSFEASLPVSIPQKLYEHIGMSVPIPIQE